jgi:hypothetical protein
VARVFEKAMEAPEGAPARLVRRATVVFICACLLTAAVTLAGAPQVRVLAKPLRIPAGDAERLGEWVLPIAGLLLASAVFGLLARFRRSAALCFLCLALFPPLAVIAGLGMLEVIFDAKSGRRIAAQLSALPQGTELACVRCFPNGLLFYLGRTATLISQDGSELTSNYIIYCLEKNPQPPKQIVLLADFANWLASRKGPVFLIAPPMAQQVIQAVAGARNASVQTLSPDYIGIRLSAPGDP